MEQEKKSIMVTWDFSAVSYNALKHAIKMAHIVKYNIVLFHIVKDQAGGGSCQEEDGSGGGEDQKGSWSRK